MSQTQINLENTGEAMVSMTISNHDAMRGEL